jgi:radical SAM protein with 4Fe4S-binding SPASM domain
MGAARPKLHSVAIELTAHCNQKCDYCYNAWREDGGAELTAQHRDKLLPRVRRLLEAVELDHVTLTGGEPFARADLFELLDLLTEHRVPAQIISNGGLITDAHAARLVPYRVRYVQVTLNGPDRALHEAHVGAGWFDRTLAGVRALVSHGVPVVGCIVLTKKNCDKTHAILELWHELGVRQIALSRFSPAGYAARHAAQLLPTRSELIEAFEQANPFGKQHGMRMTCTMPVPPCAVETERFDAVGFGTCPIGTSLQEFALGPDGRLRNCTLHGTGLGGGRDLLDPDVDIAAIATGDEPRRYREQIPEFCQGCLHAKTCAGGCGAAAEWVLGHAREHADPFVMQHIDDGLAARLERQRRDGRTHLEMIL